MVKQVKPLEYEVDSASGGKIVQPKPKENLKYLTDLATKLKSQQLSDIEFFDAVGETFISNPEFFMKELYKSFMEKMRKILDADKRWDMEKYIIEKFCLLPDEQIIYELNGNIVQTELIEQKTSGKYKMDTMPLKISVKNADIFVTNKRMIGQGTLKASGGEKTSGAVFWLTDLWVFTGGTKKAERKNALIESSPVLGYQFRTKNHWGLSKSKTFHIVAYFVNIDKYKATISIKPTTKSKRDEHLNNIFDILRKDADEVLDVIKEIKETEIQEKRRLKMLSGSLKVLFIGDEFTHLSDSDRIRIIVETYKLDPEFFMASIYPKMKPWDIPSFLSLKEEIFEYLRKEGAIID
ncbi:MAG: hypothetical protein ACXABG_10025 [Promethearchaeota archaeon]|jgi:hypothetical protein